MLEMGISQAQSQFTKLLNKTVVVVDKKSHKKKAVILPYDEYLQIIKKNISQDKIQNGVFNKFVGVLDKNVQIDDEKYNRILS